MVEKLNVDILEVNNFFYAYYFGKRSLSGFPNMLFGEKA